MTGEVWGTVRGLFAARAQVKIAAKLLLLPHPAHVFFIRERSKSTRSRGGVQHGRNQEGVILLIVHLAPPDLQPGKAAKERHQQLHAPGLEIQFVADVVALALEPFVA